MLLLLLIGLLIARGSEDGSQRLLRVQGPSGGEARGLV